MSMLTVVIRRVHKMGVVGGFKNPVGWRKEADSYSYHPWAMSDQKSILHTWTDTNSSLHRLPGSGLMSPVGWRKEADSYSYHPWAMSDQKSILHTWTDTNSSLHRLPGSGLMSPRDKILSTIQPTIRSYLWGGGKKQTATDLTPTTTHKRWMFFRHSVHFVEKIPAKNSKNSCG